MSTSGEIVCPYPETGAWLYATNNTTRPIGVIPRGTKVKFVPDKSYDDFALVVSNNHTGYVHGRNLKIDTGDVDEWLNNYGRR